jgi:hypothetical protein
MRSGRWPGSVELACVDQGYAGEEPFDATAGHRTIPGVVRRPGARRGLVPRPRRWVVGRSLGGATRLRRPVRDDERSSQTPAGLRHIASSVLMSRDASPPFVWGS